MTSPVWNTEHVHRNTPDAHSPLLRHDTNASSSSIVTEERGDETQEEKNPYDPPSHPQVPNHNAPVPSVPSPAAESRRPGDHAARRSWSPSSLRSAAPAPSSRSGDQVRAPSLFLALPVHRCATSRDRRPPLAFHESFRSLVFVSLLARVSFGSHLSPSTPPVPEARGPVPKTKGVCSAPPSTRQFLANPPLGRLRAPLFSI